MLTYSRLMELAGRKMRLDEMSVEQAKRIFSYYGGDLSADDLHQQYRKLARDNHPDRGGPQEAMRDINAAYDVLKALPKGGGEIRRHPNSAFEDFRDPDYFRRRVREVSGRDAEPMTLWAYDGRKFERFDVEGSAAAVTIMIEGMLAQFGHAIAVLVSKKSNPRRLTCLWASGKSITPTAFESKSFGPPTTDRTVVASLNQFLGLRKAA